MKDYRSIALNIVESIYYKRWAATLIREYSSAINKPFILDVGCGSNKISNSKMITGCDMFPVSDDIIQAAADDLPFESGTIDMLVSAHCLEHMANPIKTINEWCRAVGRDGVIWLIPPEYIKKAKKDDFEYFNGQRLIHHHVWTLSSFIDLLLRLNLEILYATDLVPGRKDSFSVIVRSKFNG